MTISNSAIATRDKKIGTVTFLVLLMEAVCCMISSS